MPEEKDNYPCSGLAELYFPPAGNEAAEDKINRVDRARRLCQACPIIQSCLEGALQRREPWGVWGGEDIVNGRIEGEIPSNQNQNSAA